MQRIPIPERTDWKAQAERLGFRFHTIDGAPYWDETACWRLTLRQIEDDIEGPTAEIEALCLELVERIVASESMLERLAIPEPFWDYVAGSWRKRDTSLYGRLDLAYDGTGPAKLLEYNADTPTSLYESAAFQWIWLEQAMARGIVPADCDQYNSIHEALVDAFAGLGIAGPLHLAWCQGSAEDEGTVRYLDECARQAGLATCLLPIEALGVDPHGRFTDLEDRPITALFKLYPWEWILSDPFGAQVPASGVAFIEPAWKAILSNKGILALLWESFAGHPNLLPAYFADDPAAAALRGGHVRKPLLSREGANVELIRPGAQPLRADGPYGAEGFVVQALHPLPESDGNHAVVGSWLVAGRPCGMGIREDRSPITRDSSRFVPHVIRD